jgi:hypothetical protein
MADSVLDISIESSLTIISIRGMMGAVRDPFAGAVSF